MAATDSYSTASALLKEQYVEDIAYVIPESDRISRDFPIKTMRGFGDKIVQPVEVQAAQGMTFGGSDSDAYAINTPIAASYVEASIKPSSFAQNGQIAQDLLDRLQSGGRASFISGVGQKIKSLTDQASYGKEMSLMHGGNSIGTFSARVTDSGTTQIYSITAATFMPAALLRLVGGHIDVYYSTTKVNATGTITLSAVDIPNKRVTLVGTESELDDINTNIASSPAIWFEGAYGNSMSGLFYIAGSTSSTIHGLSQSTYSNWQSNTVAMGSTMLSYDAIYEAVATLMNRGCMTDLSLYCAPKTAKDLKSQIAQKQDVSNGTIRFDAKANTLGFDNQDVVIKPHLYCKPGEAALVSPKSIERVGFDTEFVDLGGGTKSYVMPMQNYNGAFFRVHWNQALFVRNPAHTLKFTGIVNMSD